MGAFSSRSAREYHPTTGTFLTRDPIEDRTGDPYTYAGNDPINLTDPTGLCVDARAGAAKCATEDALLAELMGGSGGVSGATAGAARIMPLPPPPTGGPSGATNGASNLPSAPRWGNPGETTPRGPQPGVRYNPPIEPGNPRYHPRIWPNTQPPNGNPAVLPNLNPNNENGFTCLVKVLDSGYWPT